MLALPMARLTSAGVAQSAPLTCRYQAINGSRASACAGLRLMKALSVLSAMILTPITLLQSHIGTKTIFARWAGNRLCVAPAHFRDFLLRALEGGRRHRRRSR